MLCHIICQIFVIPNFISSFYVGINHKLMVFERFTPSDHNQPLKSESNGSLETEGQMIENGVSKS